MRVARRQRSGADAGRPHDWLLLRLGAPRRGRRNRLERSATALLTALAGPAGNVILASAGAYALRGFGALGMTTLSTVATAFAIINVSGVVQLDSAFTFDGQKIVRGSCPKLSTRISALKKLPGPHDAAGGRFGRRRRSHRFGPASWARSPAFVDATQAGEPYRGDSRDRGVWFTGRRDAAARRPNRPAAVDGRQ